jgi:hypothetical protein
LYFFYFCGKNKKRRGKKMSKAIDIRLLPTELQQVNTIKKICYRFQELIVKEKDVTEMQVGDSTFNMNFENLKTQITVKPLYDEIIKKSISPEKQLQICFMQTIYNLIEKESQTPERNFKKLLEQVIPTIKVILTKKDNSKVTVILPPETVEIEEIVITCEIQPPNVEIDGLVITSDIQKIGDGRRKQLKQKNSRRGRLNH